MHSSKNDYAGILKLNLNDFVYASLPDFKFYILFVFASFQWLK